MRVLVVEDEQSLRQAIARRLAARGYSVDEAPDGARADQLLAVADRNFKGPCCRKGPWNSYPLKKTKTDPFAQV